MLRVQEAEQEILSAPAAQTLELAQLTYSNDATAGIRRMREAKSFRYVKPASNSKRESAVKDAATLARIASLAIPPAWEDVWISPDPHGHIQATGRDLRGRKQYRYHPRWSQHRDETKYTNLIEFAAVLPRLRRRALADMQRKGVSRERVIASVVWLLDRAMIRIGNAVYARDNKSFGLTTLRTKHVSVKGEKLRFSFRGKSGKDWDVQISDRRVASVVRRVQELPGQHLFQYLDEDNQRRAVSSEDVNAYIREVTKAEFSSKNFRTWAGSVTAAVTLAELETPETKTGISKALNAAIDRVAARLGNTRAVCRKCYIHPAVIERWKEGALAQDLSNAKARLRAPLRGLQADEAVVYAWLKGATKKGGKQKKLQ